ncbi:unnamed protein product [Adineta ricciae]|uniref:Uncharacterized protein n=1 Tax=Adineta ricciae TaxID=249248 RepID=A0A814RX84_ADIRI|nr:unnamed protein product [Adineta ricciae]
MDPLLINNFPEDLKGSENVMSSTIFMLMKFGNVDEAEQLFHQTKYKSIYTYGALMKGYNDNKMFEKTLDLFETLPFVADEAIYVMALSSCSHLTNDRARRIGKQLIDNLPEDFKRSENVMNSTIFMLMKFGNVDEAEKLLHQMKHKSIYTYGAMMKGYHDNEMFEKVLDFTCTRLSNDRALQTGKELLRKMNKSYYNDDIVITSAIHMLMKFDLVNDAERLFRQVKARNALAYHAMINGYSQLDDLDKCFQLFDQMKSDRIVPNEVVFLSMIGVCAKIAIRSLSQSIVDQLASDTKSSRNIQTALISMWVINYVKKFASKPNNVAGYGLDLADLQSIKDCVGTFLANEDQRMKITALINNAGIMACPYGKTKDGFELQMGTNHFGHFYFTQILIPRLHSARIVNVASAAHFFWRVPCDATHYNQMCNPNTYHSFSAYLLSKTANILFTRELQRRYCSTDSIRAYSLHPGTVNTELDRHMGMNDIAKQLLRPIRYLIFKSPLEGIQTILYCALSNDAQPGEYHSDCRVTPPYHKYARDDKLAQEWWDFSKKSIDEKLKDIEQR